MVNSDWFATLIDEEWSLATNPVPGEGDIREALDAEPVVQQESPRDRRANQVDTQPLVFVEDGGTPTRDAISVGYREEHIEAEMSVELIASGSKQDMVGKVDSTYGGVSGEFKRILDKHRKGLVESDVSVANPGYDLILYDRLDDDAQQRGAGIWTVEWTVRFITFAQKILYK